MILNISSEKRSMSPAWPLNRFWKTLQSVSVSYPYLVAQICPQLGIVQATVILLCSPLIWRAPSIIISRPFLMQCSLFFVFLKHWMAFKLSIYLPSEFLFSFSGPFRAVFTTLFADFSFHCSHSWRHLSSPCCPSKQTPWLHLRSACLTSASPPLMPVSFLNPVPSGYLSKLGDNRFQILWVDGWVYGTHLKMKVQRLGSKPSFATFKSGHSDLSGFCFPQQVCFQWNMLVLTTACCFCLRRPNNDQRLT